jgi:hypothetical protein
MGCNCKNFNIQIQKNTKINMQNLTYNHLHSKFITIARCKSKIWSGKLYTSNLNNHRKYDTVMNVQMGIKDTQHKSYNENIDINQ